MEGIQRHEVDVLLGEVNCFGSLLIQKIVGRHFRMPQHRKHDFRQDIDFAWCISSLRVLRRLTKI
jgi:hypothetical protein